MIEEIQFLAEFAQARVRSRAAQLLVYLSMFKMPELRESFAADTAYYRFLGQQACNRGSIFKSRVSKAQPVPECPKIVFARVWNEGTFETASVESFRAHPKLRRHLG
ncbi:hypothetical protein KC878_03560 [Candidatus Saccharibacteria bacterium]|nr:hypothetical protein [Candidatus Saccharibacteria bacterium]